MHFVVLLRLLYLFLILHKRQRHKNSLEEKDLCYKRQKKKNFWRTKQQKLEGNSLLGAELKVKINGRCFSLVSFTSENSLLAKAANDHRLKLFFETKRRKKS